MSVAEAPSGSMQVVVGFKAGDAFGDIDVKREGVEQIALPGNDFAVACELESGEVGDRAVRAVFAGNPFGVIERQRAGFDGDDEVRVQNLVLCFGCIDGERDVLSAESRRFRQ